MDELETEFVLAVRLLPIILFLLSSQRILLLQLNLSNLLLKLIDFLLSLFVLSPHLVSLVLDVLLVYIQVLTQDRLSN